MNGLRTLGADKSRVVWETKTLDEVKSKETKSIISGPFGSNISSRFFVSQGIPVIRGNNLSLSIGRRFVDEGFVFITEEKANELGTWAAKDDLIFTAAGTIGQVGILDGRQKYQKYIISNKQLRVRLDKNLVDPLFAYYWFASPQMIDTVVQRDTGSTIPLINLGVVNQGHRVAYHGHRISHNRLSSSHIATAHHRHFNATTCTTANFVLVASQDFKHTATDGAQTQNTDFYWFHTIKLFT